MHNLNEAFKAALDRPSFLRMGTYSLRPDHLAKHNLPRDPEEARAVGLSHIDILHTVLQTAKERFSDPEVSIVSLMASDRDGREFMDSWDQWFENIPIGVPDPESSEPVEPGPGPVDDSHYRRSGFVLEVPSVRYELGEQEVFLSIGALRKYPEVGGSSGHGLLQLYVGFHVSVCTNLSATTDGVRLKVNARTTEELANGLNPLIDSFDPAKAVQEMKILTQRRMDFRRAMSLMPDVHRTLRRRSGLRVNEDGRLEVVPMSRRARAAEEILMYSKRLPFRRQQLIDISTRSMSDEHFGQDADGHISLWNLYNLFTEALKDAPFEKFLEQHTLVWNSIKILESLSNGEGSSRVPDGKKLNPAARTSPAVEAKSICPEAE